MSNQLETLSGELISTESLSNRAFLYGDGVFTTLRMVNSEAENDQLHWQRLRADSRKLEITTPPYEFYKYCLNKTLHQWQDDFDEDDAIIRITVFRDGGRGYANGSKENGLVHISIQSLSDFPQQLSLKVVNTRLSQNELTAGIKHLNRLEQVLAANELGEEDDEALMLDTQEHVIEATMFNIFWFQDECYFTPNLNLSGVNGLARRKLIQGLQIRNKPLKIENYSVQTVLEAKHIWVCNAVRGVLEVTSIDSQKFIVDSERTQFLQNIFSEKL